MSEDFLSCKSLDWIRLEEPHHKISRLATYFILGLGNVIPYFPDLLKQSSQAR